VESTVLWRAFDTATSAVLGQVPVQVPVTDLIHGDLGSFGPTWTMGRLEVSTGSGTPSNDSSTMREALQFCLLNQKRFAELLLNYWLQIKLCGCN
jgi:hypothetical protein